MGEVGRGPDGSCARKDDGGSFLLHTRSATVLIYRVDLFHFSLADKSNLFSSETLFEGLKNFKLF